ncbi:2e9c0f8b-eea8-47dd-99f7-8fa8443612bb [Thermothielavioides terrestris]|uniref:Uncharacterized protein n=2 Tax=Thermothielavioides terrestris TaxID=2587410 RepID=G2QXT0_THETT|nr:uncharacterized protein THITE_2108108 [Thermothielavioides terrestris NRRL 8126]AEO63198.1 hypothetical protein THITE_2108108 [Thermothielavioides terrestris NRRL 8126]SPQ21313.1 2e9c0f8b-eea8-47dd-99f7-8fa8443612bb [Thermothielavioides terrestris]
MDPSFHEARGKFRKRKPTAPQFKPTKFQKQLARNPFAKALATPVRRCPITNTVLPRFLLQRFRLVSHPETGRPWFTPADLSPKGPATGQAPVPDVSPERATAPGPAKELPQETLRGLEQKQDGASSGSEPEIPAQLPQQDLQAGASTAEQAPVARRPTKTGPSAYVLSRQTLFRELQHRKSVYFGAFQKLFRMSDHGRSHLTAALNSANWRSDMDAVLLELMRRRISEGLLHFARLVLEQDRKYIVKCERWDDAKALKHRGCLLFLGPPKGTAASPDSESSSPEYVPPRLSTMDVGPARYGSIIAVHNLCVLLGEEHVARLRQESKLFRDGWLFMLGRQATVNLQMLLWKLQGYMAWDEPQETASSDEST